MGFSLTNSNRRVRTRMHGGVAGVSGQPLPLCRSSRHHGQVTHYRLLSRRHGAAALRTGPLIFSTSRAEVFPARTPHFRGNHSCASAQPMTCLLTTLEAAAAAAIGVGLSFTQASSARIFSADNLQRDIVASFAKPPSFDRREVLFQIPAIGTIMASGGVLAGL